MDKKFCDFCGTDMTDARKFTVSIFDSKTDNTMLELYACTKCQRRIVRALNFLVKSK